MMATPAKNQDLPELVRSYLGRSLPPNRGVPALVPVQPTEEMWMKPGGRHMRFHATEDFAVESVTFYRRVRFPISGPRAVSVADKYAAGDGHLRVALSE
jgi:hypothetical protein